MVRSVQNVVLSCVGSARAGFTSYVREKTEVLVQVFSELQITYQKPGLSRLSVSRSIKASLSL